jgi:hypothetical protein
MKALAWLAVLGLVASARESINFDTAPLGMTPPGWSVVPPSNGATAKWEIRPDRTARSQPYVFAQVSADPELNRFPLAILDTMRFADGDVSVRVKPVSGRVEQAAGLVWRYHDPRNYYLVRLNALEDNVAAFKSHRRQIHAAGRPRSQAEHPHRRLVAAESLGPGAAFRRLRQSPAAD